MSQFSPQSYDPENAPEQKRTHIGRVTANHFTTIPEQYSAEAAARSAPDDWWSMEVERLDAVFEDGTAPSGTFPGNGLRWKNDAGEPYSEGSAPTVIAKAFRACPRADGVPGGFTAWPGNPRSQEIVGQVYVFEGTRIKLGKREKYLNLPVQHLGGPDYQYKGEKRIITTNRGVSIEGTQAAPVDDSATEAALVSKLIGKTPSQVFDTILGDSVLKSIPTFKGVNLIGAAADGSLVTLLPLTVNGDGTLTSTITK